MNIDHCPLELHGHLGSEAIDVLTEDPNIVQAIRRFDAPAFGVLAVLETGARAILAAAAGFDVQSLRHEVQTAVGPDGPFLAALRREADRAVPGSFLARLQESVNELRGAMTAALNLACDRQSETLGRTVRDFRELDPNSGVGAALTRIERAVIELTSAVAANRASAALYDRGTSKGLDYEELVAELVADIAAVHGDRAERSGPVDGLRRGDKHLAKRGDVTVSVGNDAAIVIEAKNSARLTSTSIQRELVEAMENRGARAAIVVVSSGQNSLMCRQPLVYLRPDMWAVHVAAEDPDPQPLQVAYVLARHAALLKLDERPLADLDLIRERAQEIMRRLAPLTEIRQHIANGLRSQESASAALLSFERELRSSVFSLIDSLSETADQAA